MALLFRRRMAISVRFRLRPAEPGKPLPALRTIQVRVRIDSDEDSGFNARYENPAGYDYAEAILIPTAQWDQKAQKQTGRDVTINNRLAQIKADLIRIYQLQAKRFEAGLGVRPGVTSIKTEFVTGKPPVVKSQTLSPNPAPKLGILIEPGITLLNAYMAYLIHLRITNLTNSLAEDTLSKWEYGLNYLKQYVPQEYPASAITRRWAKEYHSWLRGAGPMGDDAATRYVKRVSQVLDYIADEEVIDRNPIAEVRLPREGSAEVHFLETEQLAKFWQLSRPDDEVFTAVVWWLGVMMLTGMDYPVAKAYVADRAAHERSGIGGRKIVIKREKKPYNECHIPLLPELEALLTHPCPELHPNTINEFTHSIAVLIDFPTRLTIRICRKTAGAIFIRKGYSIKAVSRFLGHASVATTEKHYVRITGDYVDHEMKLYHNKDRSDDKQQSA